MTWEAVEHISVYRDADWYAAHPTVTRLPNGELLAAFHRSPNLGYPHHQNPLFDVRACRSSDDGATWSEPQLLVTNPRGGVLDFAVHVLPDGRLMLHAATVDLVPADDTPHGESWKLQRGGSFWIDSSDNGHTWSDAKSFPEVPDAVSGHPATHTGICRSSMLAVDDNRLLLTGRATAAASGGFPYFGTLFTSDDGGSTWTFDSRMIQDEVAHFGESTMVRLPSGRIVALFRCHPGPGRTVEDRFLAETFSDDDGKTWSSWSPTTVFGYPPHALTLRDGRVFLSYGVRTDRQAGCTARVVDKELAHLNRLPDVHIRHGSKGPDCGYPWSVQLNDDRVLVVYYFTNEDGSRSIEGTIMQDK